MVELGRIDRASWMLATAVSAMTNYIISPQRLCQRGPSIGAILPYKLALAVANTSLGTRLQAWHELLPETGTGTEPDPEDSVTSHKARRARRLLSLAVSKYLSLL